MHSPRRQSSSIGSYIRNNWWGTSDDDQAVGLNLNISQRIEFFGGILLRAFTFGLRRTKRPYRHAHCWDISIRRIRTWKGRGWDSSNKNFASYAFASDEFGQLSRHTAIVLDGLSVGFSQWEWNRLAGIVDSANFLVSLQCVGKWSSLHSLRPRLLRRPNR